MPVVLPTPDPIEIETPAHGVVRLRWLSLNSLASLEDLLDKKAPPEELLLLVIHEHLLSPNVTLDELRAWTQQDVQALAVGWAAAPLGLGTAIDAANLPASFVEAVKERVAASGREVQGALNGAFDVIRRQNDRLQSLTATPAVLRGLTAFAERQAAWRQALLGPSEELRRQLAGSGEALRRQLAGSEALRRELMGPGEALRRQMAAADAAFATLEAAHRRAALMANSAHAALLGDVSSAVANNARLLGIAPALAAMTDGLRAAAEHQGRLMRLANLDGLSRGVAAQLSHGLESLVSSARGVWVDWERLGPTPRAGWLMQAPSVEVFSASRAAAAVVGESLEDDPAGAVDLVETAALHVEPMLARLDVDLLQAYRGAVQAVDSTNPDAGRHVGASLRELLTHVMHRLAPDPAVKDWPKASADDFDEKGRATRRLRLRYIFRRLEATTYDRFVEDDVQRALDVIDALHNPTHSMGKKIERIARLMTLRRAEGVLALLLEAGTATDE
jgi:hypothetical protein